MVGWMPILWSLQKKIFWEKSFREASYHLIIHNHRKAITRVDLYFLSPGRDYCVAKLYDD